MAKDEVKIEYRPLGHLEPATSNPKLHDLEKIKDSIRRFGFVTPVVEDTTTKRLVAGHGRLEALKQMRDAGEERPARIGLHQNGSTWTVPVLTGVSFKDEKEAEAFLLMDNRLVELGGWNDESLAALLAHHDAAGLGWEEPPLVDEAPAIGPSPEDLEAQYNAAEIKQIVLYFSTEEYTKALEQLQKVMDDSQLQSNTEAVLHLLETYADSKRSA